MKKATALAQLFLRIALGISFLSACFDRFGWIAPNGSSNVSWGDWEHFSRYAHVLMPFFSAMLAEWLAITATVMEFIFGILLIIGLFIRGVSLGSGLLLITFAVSMSITLGMHAPLSYSVFTAGAACLLLATIPNYKWSLDVILANKKANIVSMIQVN